MLKILYNCVTGIVLLLPRNNINHSNTLRVLFLGISITDAYSDLCICSETDLRSSLRLEFNILIARNFVFYWEW